MKITKRHLRKIIREAIILENVESIGAPIENYLDRLLRELEMSGGMDPLSGGAFDAPDVYGWIQNDTEAPDSALSLDVNSISEILSGMADSGMLEFAGKGTTKSQGRYWNVYYTVDFPDHSPRPFGEAK